MPESEKLWDNVLHIQTCGRDDINADRYHHPYEPTPYSVLERLADSGYFGENDVLLDYGCGKGRVSFFMSNRTQVTALGVEYDKHILEKTYENLESYGSNSRIRFLLENASEFIVPSNINRCYFFNPFSVEILRKAMAKILDSYYENPREILLFFYYPSDEYIGYLMNVDELEFYDEIDCSDLFHGDEKRERVLVFCLPDFDYE